MAKLAAKTSGPLFVALLVAATLGPNLLAIETVAGGGILKSAAARGIWLFQLFAAPHVMATLYLFFERRDYAGVPRPGVTLLAIPLALLALNVAVLLAAPMGAVLAYMLFFVGFTIWHFGRQNAGLVSLANRIAGRKRKDRFEETTILLGNVAGLLGAYHAFAPVAFMLKPAAWPLDLSVVDPVLSRVWYAGAALLAGLVPFVLYRVAAGWKAREAMARILYAASVFFFAPLYLSRNPLFAVGTWAFAHGAQYLVLLSFHAGARARANRGLEALKPLALFLVPLFAGVVLWQFGARLQNRGSATEIRLALAALNGLTIMHYWVERYLWRFSIPERRAWLEESFAFLRLPEPRGGDGIPAALEAAA
ncbi:MAG: hypothetical protein JOZ55_06920 [Alphaproteobacteria bacterium]|nr:hypothetical protein [Alphaproteobacteria bacterium]